MICSICGEMIVEGIVENALDAQARKLIHRATKHDPVLGFALILLASVVISWAVPRAWKAIG